jgi:aldehyde dehydrogenase (NAD+)
MQKLLSDLNLTELNPGAYSKSITGTSNRAVLKSFSPIDNSLIASAYVANESDYESVIKEAKDTFDCWREVPAPQRGLVVREIAEELRKYKSALGRLISIEVGKIIAEAEGEVQEAIDMADFAVGLSRQLYGKTMPSERPGHKIIEQWHPLGVVGCITAFNFPAAVWAWNSMLAAVCGDTIVWKPSEHAPITAIAMNSICRNVASKHGYPGLFSLLISDGSQIGQRMASDKRLPLISATGSCAMGRSVGENVAKRLGKSLLELGGNNAVIVLDDADLNLVLPAVLFGAVGTAGQRCTTTRRLIVQKGIEKQLTEKLIAAYKQVKIGSPLESKVLMGPLINKKAVESYQTAISTAKTQGGQVLYGAEILKNMPSDLYVQPTIVKTSDSMPIVNEETFAPILYIITVDNLDHALKVNNQVSQGLSSSIFTNNFNAVEQFLSCRGSDCGLANVNIGTSGAEIGGAFGGEKDTGGGRESGSDSWQQYMRRQTNTLNYSKSLPLAQGIKFD